MTLEQETLDALKRIASSLEQLAGYAQAATVKFEIPLGVPGGKPTSQRTHL